jgi:enoyl-CoA hydratase
VCAGRRKPFLADRLLYTGRNSEFDERMSTGHVAFETAGGVATLRLCNPSRRNAMSVAMWHELAGFAADLASRGDVRVVIVRGDGDKAFSAGADIRDFAGKRSAGEGARAYDGLVEDTCRAIEAIPQPTLAVVVGACMGAGVSIAASCDLRIAAEDAFFSVPAARLGLGYDPWGIARCLRVFGADATRELIFLADRLPARRVAELGAVSRLVPAARIDALAAEWTGRIASNAPLTIKAAKLAVRAHILEDPALLAEAQRLYAAADASADYVEGRRAFAEKRTPRFTGR